MLRCHRSYHVVRGQDGYSLNVIDESWTGVIAETVNENMLAALGHPCCGKGPLSRLTLRYGTLRKLGIWWGRPEPEEDWEEDLDENALDLFWFRVLNLPNRLRNRLDVVARIPLTEEQARALHPESVDGPSADGE